MVTIPAGQFLLGSKRIDGDPYGKWTQFDDTELPQQPVWLDTYEIDRDEVSLGEYLAYLQRKKLSPSPELQKLIWHVITVHFVSDQTLTRWPALYVTWAEAQGLCASKRARLPTEAEWEKAARGTDGRLYPWGNEPPTAKQANFDREWAEEKTLHAVGALPGGDSPYGVKDMAGNAREWVSDWYDAAYYQQAPNRNPQGPDKKGVVRSIRGGSWHSPAADLTTAARGRGGFALQTHGTGFRCARGGE